MSRTGIFALQDVTTVILNISRDGSILSGEASYDKENDNREVIQFSEVSEPPGKIDISNGNTVQFYLKYEDGICRSCLHLYLKRHDTKLVTMRKRLIGGYEIVEGNGKIIFTVTGPFIERLGQFKDFEVLNKGKVNVAQLNRTDTQMEENTSSFQLQYGETIDQRYKQHLLFLLCGKAMLAFKRPPRNFHVPMPQCNIAPCPCQTPQCNIIFCPQNCQTLQCNKEQCVDRSKLIIGVIIMIASFIGVIATSVVYGKS